MELSVEHQKELEVVEKFHTELKRIDAEIRKIIVGQKDVVDQVMMSMLSGGHSIITGVPGLAKTLLIATVARVLHLDFVAHPLGHCRIHCAHVVCTVYDATARYLSPS